MRQDEPLWEVWLTVVAVVMAVFSFVGDLFQ